MFRSLLLVLLLAPLATAQAPPLWLPAVFGDHAVLQRDLPLPVWGRAAPGETVTVTLAGHTATATAAADGRWQVVFAPLAHDPDKPDVTLEVTGSAHDRPLRRRDLRIGEVWLASGQSNMEWPLRASAGGAQAIAAAGKQPDLRLLRVPRRRAARPADDVRARWARSSPQSARDISGVGFFFGALLQRELKVPVGVISASWGGTRIEPWLAPAGLAGEPTLAGLRAGLARADAQHLRDSKEALNRIRGWVALADAWIRAGNAPPPPPQMPPHPLERRGVATGLFNGMIAPLTPTALRGVLWYQGESNLRDGAAYLPKLRALLAGWRQAFVRPALPLHVVGLAPYRYGGDPLQLPAMWAAQAAAARTVDGIELVVTTDVGNPKDIHPRDKRTVGERLARQALVLRYGRPGVARGPRFARLEVKGARAIVHWSDADDGLATRDGEPPSHFEIAGADRRFHAAQATIDGATVVVTHPGVAAPVAVRFGWHQTAMPNLMRNAGWPAAPFRSDDGPTPVRR